MTGRKDFQAGLAASIAIHLVVLACVLRFTPAPVEDTSEPVVSVTMVPLPLAPEGAATPHPSPIAKPAEPQEPEPPPPQAGKQDDRPASAPPAQAPAQSPATAPDSAPPPAPPSEPGPKMIQAGAFYAAAILARPENRSARDALKTLSAAERNEQICDTEAMEQIRRADAKLRPDRLIAYALMNTEVDGDRLHAPGAAFRSAHRWFRLTFDCVLDPRQQTVTAFSFAIGAPIPSSAWNDLQLER